MTNRIKDLIKTLPEAVQHQIEEYRQEYTFHKEEYNNSRYNRMAEVRQRMAGYALGLRDAGLITERDRQYIFVYMTV